MPIQTILKHTARVYGRADFDAWVDGQPDVAADAGTSFPCVVFQDPRLHDRGIPEVRVPGQLMYAPGPALERDAVVFVTAPEQNLSAGLPADAALRWLVLDLPNPLGKPGRTPKAVEVGLAGIPYNATLTGIYHIGDYEAEPNDQRWSGEVAIFYDDGGGDLEAPRALVVDEPVADALAFTVGTRLTFDVDDVSLTARLEHVHRRIPGSGGLVKAIRLILDEVLEAE